MAKLNLFQEKTYQKYIENTLPTIKDLDESINYLWHKVITVTQVAPTFFIEYGAPMKWPNGKYGFEVIGMLRGYQERPDAKEDDYRVSYRTLPVPKYDVTLGAPVRRRNTVTNYPDKNTWFLERPEVMWMRTLQAMAQSYPIYLLLLFVFLFKSKNFDIKKIAVLDDYIKQYYDEADGAAEGYSFYPGNKGKYAINYSDMKDGENTKKTNHPFKERLKKINEKLWDDTAKISCTLASSNILKHQKSKNDIAGDDLRKFIAVCEQIYLKICEIKRSGTFDEKYRVHEDDNKKKFEGFIVPCDLSDLILLISDEDVCNFNLEFGTMNVPGTVGFRPDQSYFGVQTIPVSCIEKGKALLMHKDLVKVYFLPEYNKNFVDRYDSEGTEDYIVEFAHTVDLIDVYYRMWFEAA